MYSISQTKSFEAAHYIDVAEGYEGYRRLHGHSFVITVTCSAEEPNEDGWVVDFMVLDRIMGEVCAIVDHSLLNEIEGLEQSTFENIMRWFYLQMVERGITPSKIEIERPSLRQKGTYIPK